MDETETETEGVAVGGGPVTVREMTPEDEPGVAAHSH